MLKYLKITFLLILASIQFGCATTKPKSSPRITRANEMLLKGNISEAKKLLADVTAIDSEYYDACYIKGLIAFKEKDKQTYVDAFAKAVELKPEGEDARFNYGAALAFSERYLDAYLQFRYLVEDLESKDPEALKNMIDCKKQAIFVEIEAAEKALAAEDKAFARKRVDRILQFWPESLEAKKILEKF